MTRTTPLPFRSPTWLERNGEALVATLGASMCSFCLGMILVASWAGVL